MALTNTVPEPALKRLPLYLQYLRNLADKSKMNISAPVIGDDLGYDPTQVVKDLAYTGVRGKPRVGYNIYELIYTIENFLGFNKVNDAFLIGAGNLGKALLSYQDFQHFGMKIIAAFDVDNNKVGTQVNSVNILHIDKLEDLVKRLNIKIGILTTPAACAQKVAEQMHNCGIRGIWNLTPVYLKMPPEVIIQNTSMYSNVAVLLNKLNNAGVSM